MAGREDFFYLAAQQIFGADIEEFFSRGTDQHSAAFDIEQQQSIFEAGHDLIHVFAQGAEDFPDVAQLLPDATNFVGYLDQFAGLDCGFRIEFSGGDAIQLCGDAREWRERDLAYERRKEGGKDHSAKRNPGCGVQARPNLVAQKRGRDSHMDLAKRLLAHVEWVGDFVNTRRTVENAELISERRIHQGGKIRPRRYLLAGKRRVAGNERGPIVVGDSDFVDCGGIAHVGFDQRGKARIFAERLLNVMENIFGLG